MIVKAVLVKRLIGKKIRKSHLEARIKRVKILLPVGDARRFGIKFKHGRFCRDTDDNVLCCLEILLCAKGAFYLFV